MTINASQQTEGLQAKELADFFLGSLEEQDPDVPRAREDLIFYSEYLFEDEEGKPFKNQPFHEEIYRALLDDGIRYLLILVGRGAGKSQLCSIVFPSYMLGRNPNLRFCICSDSRDQSAQFLRAVESVLQSKKYQELFGNLVPPPKTSTWNDYEKYCIRSNPFIKEPSLLALGARGAVPSRRADFLIGDDLVSEQNSATSEMRAKLSRWFWKVFTPFMKVGTRFIIIGTPYYPGDLYDELSEKWSDLPNAKVLHIPALQKDEAGNLFSIWPQRYPLDILLELQQFDPIAFSSQYQLVPLTETAERVEFDVESASWFSELPEPDEPVEVYAAFDPGGWGKRRQTNYFSIAVAYRQGNDRTLRLAYSRIGRGGLEAHADALNEMYELWEPRKIFFETNAAQMMIFEYLKSETQLPLKGVNTQSQKDARMAVLARHCKSGRVKLRGSESKPHPDIKPFWEQFVSYPSGRVDALDAVALLVESLLGKGPPPAFRVQEPAQEIAQEAERMPSLTHSRLFHQGLGQLFPRQSTKLFHSTAPGEGFRSPLEQARQRLSELMENSALTNEEILSKIEEEFDLAPSYLQAFKALLGERGKGNA